MNSREELAVRVSHMSKWFTDQSYEATTLREVVDELRNGNAQRPLPEPVMWVCLVEAARAGEKHIRAWTSDPERAQRFREIDGLDMQPLYAVTSTVRHDVEKTEDRAS